MMPVRVLDTIPVHTPITPPTIHLHTHPGGEAHASCWCGWEATTQLMAEAFRLSMSHSTLGTVDPRWS